MSRRLPSALAAFALLAAGCAPDGLGLKNPDFLVIAHRGAPAFTAENTIRSFEVSAALGGNAIETDICITRDGVLVIWHDRNPDDIVAGIRQLGQEGLAYSPHVPPIGSPYRRRVEELTLAELQANYGYNDVNGVRDPTARIATFDEMLTWAESESRLKAVYLDIKLGADQPDAARALVNHLSDEIAVRPELSPKTFFLLNVNPSIARILEATRLLGAKDSMRTALDCEQPKALQSELALGLRDVSMGLTPAVTWSAFRKEVADTVRARERGEIDSVTVWTFDDPRKLAELLYYSVDGIMTNNVPLLNRMWQETIN